MFQFTPSTNPTVLPQSFRLHQPITDITRIIVSLFNNDPLENHKPGAVRKLYIISFFESDGKQDK